MRSKTIKKAIATVAAAAMVITSIVPAAPAQAAVKAKKLTVKTKKIVLYKGAAAGYGSKQLKVTVKPKKAKVTYKINKKKVASVSKKGLVKAKKPGNAKITIKSGSKKVVVKVVVKKIKKKVTKVTATKNITVNVGAKQKIKTSVKPKKATLKALAFTSNAKKIAKVNAKGVITGIKAGNAKITVKAVDGSKKKATVAVLVTGAAIASNPAITTGPSVTTAPTVAPTATVAPTTVPTVAPTAAPTETPVVSPSTSPVVSPSTSPVVSPSTEPTAAPVETIAPVVKDNGDLSYNLPALAEGSSYKVSFGEGNDAEITAGAVAAIETIRDRFEASAQKDAVKAAESFVTKAYDKKAFGGFVVNKEAGKDTAVVSYNGKDYNLTVKADGDYKIAVITMDSVDQHWVSLKEGAEEEAKADDVTVDFMAPDVKDDAKQIECINNAVAGGYDALMVAANSEDAVSGALQEAIDAGMKLVYVDSPANVEAEATFSTDNKAAGKTAGEEMIKALEDKGVKDGSIGIVNINNSTNTAIQREAGFREAFEGTDYELLETQFCEGDAAKAQTIAENYITEGVVGIYGTNEGASTGVGNAIKASGSDEIIGVGFDKSDTLKGLIEDGYLVCTMAQNPDQMGKLGVQACIKALNGEDLGGEVTDTGVSVLTKESLAEDGAEETEEAADADDAEEETEEAAE